MVYPKAEDGLSAGYSVVFAPKSLKKHESLEPQGSGLPA